MRREQLPITALPPWCKLNDVSFLDVSVQDLGTKGYGIAAEKALSSEEETFDIPALLLVAKDLILSREFTDEHAKVDQHFRQLLEATGGKSLRYDVLLFLLMQITIAAPHHGQNVGLSNPWTEYVKMLPGEVPVPTMWSEEERIMLVGTSLESAVNAKMAALLREFGTLREQTAAIPWCQKCWWEKADLDFMDWVLLDAWYRSRCLEIPNAGESMIPCVDMVNHSSKPNSYYEPTPDSRISLLLRPGVKLDVGSEVTISYGTSKTQAEMLFSYGFIDEDSTANGLVLSLEPFLDDPLGKAKAASFIGPPVVRISSEEGNFEWESPFLYLMCLNEEDGLDFRILQQTDGSCSQLKVFWQGSDVTNKTNTFETLIQSHTLGDVFKLRAVALLQDRIRGQLERIYESEETVESFADQALVRGFPERQRLALQLRNTEAAILNGILAALDVQKNKLLESEVVLQYLGSMDDEDQPEQQETNEVEDFS